MTAGLTAGRNLRHQRPGSNDRLQHLGIPDRVQAVHSPGRDRHGGALLQRPAVSAGVDTEGTPGDDETTPGRHSRGQGCSHPLTVPGGGSGPHQSQAQPAGRPRRHPVLTHRPAGARGALSVVSNDPVPVSPSVLVLQLLATDQQRRVTTHPQAEGRLLQLVEPRRPPGISWKDEAPPEAVEHVQLATDVESFQTRCPPRGHLRPVSAGASVAGGTRGQLPQRRARSAAHTPRGVDGLLQQPPQGGARPEPVHQHRRGGTGGLGQTGPGGAD